MVQALQEAPLFGEEVHDQPNDPLPLVATEGKSIVAVYDGEDVRTITSRDLIGADRGISLTIQAFLPAEVEVQRPSGSVRVFTKNNGGPILLSMLDRRIEQILTTGSTPWATILRGIILRIKEMHSASYLIEDQEGLRITAREWVFVFDTLASPPIGEHPLGIWADLIKLLRNEPELCELADLIEIAIESPTSLAPWQKAMAALGITEAGARGLGLGPEELLDD